MSKFNHFLSEVNHKFEQFYSKVESLWVHYYSIVCQDMMVWKPDKLQSYKIEDLFDVELYLTVQSYTNPLSQLR